jgi:heat shock protein HslJ
MMQSVPVRLRLCIAGCVIGACTGENSQVALAMQDGQDLAGTTWQVEDIDAGGIADNARITIEIPDATRVEGFAGCNRYFAALALGAEEFRASGAGKTARACGPALDEQERRFLVALRDARRFATDGTLLHLYDAEGKARIRATSVSDAVSVADERPEDLPDADVAAPVVHFHCGDATRIAIEFDGPDTLKLTLPDGNHVLPRDGSASGARYAGDGIRFWNKGEEATLDIGGVEQRCRKE